MLVLNDFERRSSGKNSEMKRRRRRRRSQSSVKPLVIVRHNYTTIIPASLVS